MREHNGGLLWLAALVLLLFLLALPCCVIWSLLRRRSIKGSLNMAGDGTDSQGNPVSSAYVYLLSRLRAVEGSGLRLEVQGDVHATAAST